MSRLVASHGASRGGTPTSETDTAAVVQEPELHHSRGLTRPGVSSEEARRIAELEREVRELRRAIEIPRTASALFASAELDRRLK